MCNGSLLVLGMSSIRPFFIILLSLNKINETSGIKIDAAPHVNIHLQPFPHGAWGCVHLFLDLILPSHYFYSAAISAKQPMQPDRGTAAELEKRFSCVTRNSLCSAETFTHTILSVLPCKHAACFPFLARFLPSCKFPAWSRKQLCKLPDLRQSYHSFGINSPYLLQLMWGRANYDKTRNYATVFSNGHIKGINFSRNVPS